MKNMSFQKLILASFSIIIVLVIGVSIISVLNLTRIANATLDGHQQITKPFEHMVSFSVVYGNIRSSMRDLGRSTEEADNIRHKAAIENNLDLAIGFLGLYYDTVNKYITNQDKYDAVKATYEAMVEYGGILTRRLIPAGMANDEELVFSIITSELAPYGTIIRENISYLSEFSSEQSYASVDRATANRNRSTAFSVAGLVVIVIITLFIYKFVRKQIHELVLLTESADKISSGDIDISGLDDGTSETKNEVIRLERAFSKMIESFKKQAYILARVAEGDYTSKVDIRSEKDVINLAIELMLDETLSVLQQVASAGVQVSDASKQIANGAQLLAQGATEQSATIEDLSTSMSEMSKMTKESAVKANQAAGLAETIKNNAEKGSHQMTEMIEAVKDINQASQNISKVIKIIDDIAFQTNILALNAAVEAARAGQHGKGFAVVAEEVRNLAAKSAEAANDTNDMISSSIKKAELGSKIASETAASLEEIVSGIIESNKIISDIAAASEMQSENIDRIDSNINQVAQVVHQNSATAEESAAASEEMSGQSEMLEKLIMQFQLRDEQSKIMKNRSSAKERKSNRDKFKELLK